MLRTDFGTPDARRLATLGYALNAVRARLAGRSVELISIRCGELAGHVGFEAHFRLVLLQILICRPIGHLSMIIKFTTMSGALKKITGCLQFSSLVGAAHP